MSFYQNYAFKIHPYCLLWLQFVHSHCRTVPRFVIHSTIDGHLGSFQFKDIINSVYSCLYLSVTKCEHFFGVYTWEWNCWVIWVYLCSVLINTVKQLLQVTTNLYLLPELYESFSYSTSSRKLNIISFLGLSFWGVCEDITLFLRSPNDSMDRKGSEPLLCPYPYDHLRLMKIMLLLLLSDSMFL